MSAHDLRLEIDRRNEGDLAALRAANAIMRQQIAWAGEVRPMPGKCEICGVTVHGIRCAAHTNHHPQHAGKIGQEHE